MSFTEATKMEIDQGGITGNGDSESENPSSSSSSTKVLPRKRVITRSQTRENLSVLSSSQNSRPKRKSPRGLSLSGSESKSTSEQDGKRTEPTEGYPSITWTMVEEERQAIYVSKRFAGQTFRFREDKESSQNGTGPKLFACIDCIHKETKGLHSMSPHAPRVKISSDYTTFTEDPDYTQREHSCIAKKVVHVAKKSAPQKSKIDENPTTSKDGDQKSNENKEPTKPKRFFKKPSCGKEENIMELTEEQLSTILKIEYCKLFYKIKHSKNPGDEAVKVAVDRPIDWNVVKDLKAKYPSDYIDVFVGFYLRCKTDEEINAIIHERFLQLVQTQFASSTLTAFGTEFTKWKNILIANVTQNKLLNIDKNEVTDVQAFQWSVKLIEKNAIAASRIEYKLDQFVISLAVNTHPIRAKPYIIALLPAKNMLFSIAAQRQFFKEQFDTFADALQHLLELYVVFDIEVDAALQPIMVLMERMYGLQRSPVTAELNTLLENAEVAFSADKTE